MDIEPLWTLGGWFLLQNCMAEPKTTSSSPISETFTKSHPFLQFLALLFIFLLLINLSNPSTMTSSNSIKPSESTSSSTNLNPRKTQSSRTSPTREREFGA
ncbi:CLAVATA3/ESR (CLE)-related protein TDIF [Quillaja saponaria]|uniref:CLAVATA3/ESR (CLE)-related protein TDIF n=1 Tax=Quillaja saponaria TaxID=32244 RepID=A0AAD7LNL9_QUISA|nr:CLAVATA3/ESR (CLE)-related protein TDIF [Quillaja saponaria]